MNEWLNEQTNEWNSICSICVCVCVCIYINEQIPKREYCYNFWQHFATTTTTTWGCLSNSYTYLLACMLTHIATHTCIYAYWNKENFSHHHHHRESNKTTAIATITTTTKIILFFSSSCIHSSFQPNVASFFRDCCVGASFYISFLKRKA